MHLVFKVYGGLGLFRHLLQGQTSWKVQGLSDLKFEVKCIL